MKSILFYFVFLGILMATASFAKDAARNSLESKIIDLLGKRHPSIDDQKTWTGMNESKAVDALINIASKNESAVYQIRAISALGHYSQNEKALAFLDEMIAQPDEMLRQAAFTALSKADGDYAAARLLEQSEKGTPESKVRAKSILTRLSKRIQNPELRKRAEEIKRSRANPRADDGSERLAPR